MELAGGTRKRTRASDVAKSSAGCPDRLSALPDSLLHVILSFLKARQAVQTCVLSTRWRHLWRSVPCLDVDIVEFRTKAAAHTSTAGGCGSDSDSTSDSDDGSTDTDSGNNQDKAKQWDESEDFAVNLMLHCNIALLDSFRLDIDRGWKPRSYGYSISATEAWEYSGRQAAAWLRRAMKYCTPGPDHSIRFSRRQRHGPKNLSPSSAWRLKRLQLCHVPLDNRFAEHLSSVCRSLEDLELDHCICEIRSIASGSLKNLVLRRCTWDGFLSDIASPTLKTLVIDGGSNLYGNQLAISAPMVAYLRLDVDGVAFHGGISIKKMPSLDRASIHLRNHKYSYVSKSMCGSKLGGDQSKLLCGVSNATSLELSGVGTMVLGKEKEPTFLEFQNLRNLLLGDCDLSDFRTLRFFLRGSPNLKKVTLRHCKFPGDSDDEEGMRKPDKASSSGGCCCGLDLLRDENVELEIIHKDGNACRSADELVHNLPNQGTADAAVPDADATEGSMPRSTGVGPRRGTRCRMTNVRISGPEWE